MIRSQEHYEALNRLAVLLNADVRQFEAKSVQWLESAYRLAAAGVVGLDTSGNLVSRMIAADARVSGHDLLEVLGK